MTANQNAIREVNTEKDDQGNIARVTVVFGPHYFIDLQTDENGILTLCMGATHHGFVAPANEVGTGLEAIIYEIREQHPELATD